MNMDNCLEVDLLRLVDLGEIEVFIKSETREVFIPHMMNDAVECYYQFKDCTTQGQWLKECQEPLSFSLVEEKEKKGLILRQGNVNTLTIWYGQVEKVCHCYQYHRIGHFWVKGQEKWRRIVYVIGSIQEKASIVGEEVCLEGELYLAKLTGFAPFRYWTPLDISLDYYYEDSLEGILVMKEILARLGEKKLLGLVEGYEEDYIEGRITDRKIKRLAKALIQSQSLYNFLETETDALSSHYKPRVYDAAESAKMEELRKKSCQEYYKKGFQGAYPILYKGRKKVIFYEEHPYILREFEYEGFDFQVQPLLFS